MNRYRTFVALVFSLVTGCIAAGVFFVWATQKTEIDFKSVVVATQDIPAGTKLTETMVKKTQWPKAAVFKDPLSSLDETIDRVVNITVLQGEPLLKSKLAPHGEKGGLSAQLQSGKRAVAVKVNEIVGVAGFALPGNFVDVMVNTQDAQSNLISKIVLERIQVLAVAQDLSSAEYKPKIVNAVTLEVTPAQAEAIDLARSIGTLSLVLRNQRDTETVVTNGARKIDLLGTKLNINSVNLQGLSASAAQPKLANDKVNSENKTLVIRGLAVTKE
jgi:pilus assembly protein CpaB